MAQLRWEALSVANIAVRAVIPAIQVFGERTPGRDRLPLDDTGAGCGGASEDSQGPRLLQCAAGQSGGRHGLRPATQLVDGVLGAALQFEGGRVAPIDCGLTGRGREPSCDRSPASVAAQRPRQTRGARGVLIEEAAP